jgi:hypothetical protein
MSLFPGKPFVSALASFHPFSCVKHCHGCSVVLMQLSASNNITNATHQKNEIANAMAFKQKQNKKSNIK